VERAELARRLGAELAVHEPATQRFMAAFGDAVASGAEVFLADPEWSGNRRSEFDSLVERARGDGERLAQAGRGWLMIPSGGTSGALKLARHDEETIGAAVRGFGAHFGLQRVNAVGVLPLHHVSGLMAWMRCVLTGGDFWPWDWKRLEGGERPVPGSGDWVISLVPTQLQRLLQTTPAVEWLRQFAAIFVGGGPIWPALANEAARLGLRIAPSYGMTETAAMVTALRPEEFLRGARSAGSPLPHARVSSTEEGVVKVGGASLFLGYWPERRESGEFVTEDLGEIDVCGHLHVLGRRDAAIITGGKKVQAALVEAALRASGEFEDVAVIGVPDAEWGEAVVACYPAGGRSPDEVRACAGLASHERPKRFVAIADWPRSAAGKVNRAELAGRWTERNG
jgi:o-succinylbenzoate---CoA ligase